MIRPADTLGSVFWGGCGVGTGGGLVLNCGACGILFCVFSFLSSGFIVGFIFIPVMFNITIIHPYIFEVKNHNLDKYSDIVDDTKE